MRNIILIAGAKVFAHERWVWVDLQKSEMWVGCIPRGFGGLPRQQDPGKRVSPRQKLILYTLQLDQACLTREAKVLLVSLKMLANTTRCTANVAFIMILKRYNVRSILFLRI